MAKRQISRSDAAVNAEYARSVLDYDPDTGQLRWKLRPLAPKRWNDRYAGNLVGTPSTHGYLVFRLNERTHYAHRAIWLIVTGDWPSLKVDHRNGIQTDNRWKNLRLVDDVANSINQKVKASNTSGHKGVSWNKRDHLWEAYLSLRRKRYSLGRYHNIGDAIEARREAEVRLHGQFARTS